MVGATAPSLQDLHPTPTDGLMPGAEIQANAIETVLRGLPASRRPGGSTCSLIVLSASSSPLVGAAGPARGR